MTKNRTAMESSRRKQSADERADRVAKNRAAMESARKKQLTEDKAENQAKTEWKRSDIEPSRQPMKEQKEWPCSVKQ